MDDGTANRREHYLAKIKEAEEMAARSMNPEMQDDLRALIAGYHRLMGRLPPVTDSEH